MLIIEMILDLKTCTIRSQRHDTAEDSVFMVNGITVRPSEALCNFFCNGDDSFSYFDSADSFNMSLMEKHFRAIIDMRIADLRGLREMAHIGNMLRLRELPRKPS